MSENLLSPESIIKRAKFFVERVNRNTKPGVTYSSIMNESPRLYFEDVEYLVKSHITRAKIIEAVGKYFDQQNDLDSIGLEEFLLKELGL